MAIRKKRSMASRLSAQRYKKPKIKTAGMESDMGKAFPVSEIKIKKTQVDGNDVRFTATSDTITPYDGAVDLQDFDFPQAAEYGINGADPLAGGLSIREDGTTIPTTKVTRTRFGVIMSSVDDNVQSSSNPYVVPLVKHVFLASSYIGIIDTSITQLKRVPKEISKPKNAPIIQTVQCYPGFGTLDGQYSDGYSIQVLPELGEPSLQLAANNTLVLMSKAYNYVNELGTRINQGLTYTWKFNADGIGNARDQVVGNTQVLRLNNVQLQQRGRYHLEVSNEKGTTSSKSYFVNVLGGLLNALTPQQIGEQIVYIPTGDYVRDEFHDEEVSKYDNYFDYVESEGRWIELEWQNNQWVEVPGGAKQSVRATGDDDNPVTKIDGGISTAAKVTKATGGVYRRVANELGVYFDAPGGISYKFKTETEYFEHRAARGLPRDWSNIQNAG